MTILSGITKKQKSKITHENILEATLYDIGVFYLIQLEPEHDPNRIKVGFANDLDERLRKHRCSAPFARVLESWPCRRLWEKTVIESITINCERIHTEVFRVPSIEILISRCIQFFDLMPQLLKIENDKS